MSRISLLSRVTMTTAALALAAGTAVAQPTGTLNITGSLRLTTSGGLFIDILNGGLVRGETGSTGSFASIMSGTTGTMLDFQPNVGSVDVPGILTIGGFTFNLQQVFAGVFASASCSASPAAPGQICTPAGTAFNLVNLSANSSTASFRVGGTVMNGGGTSNFTGTFTTQFDNQNFQQASAAALSATGLQTAFSAQLTATSSVVPEPSSYLLMATGLVALGGVVVRRRNMA
jgi:hypothetical protein